MAFKKDFIFGTATAAYQIEGAAKQDGRKASVWDIMCTKKGAIKNGDTGDIACDHYNRLEEDLDLLSELGVKAYRFSVSWSRVFPDGVGKVNEKGLSFYDRLVDGLNKRGITPYCTLFHWDYPEALFLKGGWLNRDSVQWFTDYAVFIVKHFEGRITNYITLNEPQCFIQGHRDGNHAPGLKYGNIEMCYVAHHAMLAHGTAVTAMRAAAKKPISIAISLCGNPKMPYSNSEEDKKAALQSTWSMVCDFGSDILYMDPVYTGKLPKVLLDEHPYYTEAVKDGDLKAISAPLDYFGVNMYTSYYMKADGKGGFIWMPKKSAVTTNSLGWEVVPEVVYIGVKQYYEKYKLPIVITENGYCGLDPVDTDGRIMDYDRINFIKRYLMQVERAVSEGIDVKGYFYWSFMDNFEWALGYDPRFGLVHVDYENGLKRTIKESGKYYRNVIKSGKL